MYIHPTILQAREYLKDVLSELKSAGYRTFLSRDEATAYGLVEKDGSIVHIGKAPYGTGLCLGYAYPASKSHGSGIGWGDHYLGFNDLKESDIQDCINHGRIYASCHRITPYGSAEEYLKDNDLYMPF